MRVSYRPPASASATFCSEEIGRVKKENNVAILQGGRWSSIVDRVVSQAPKLGVSEEFLKTVLEAIHLESINLQNKIMNE